MLCPTQGASCGLLPTQCYKKRTLQVAEDVHSGSGEAQLLRPSTPPEPYSDRCNCNGNRKRPIYPEMSRHNKGGLGSKLIRLEGKEVHSKECLSSRLLLRRASLTYRRMTYGDKGGWQEGHSHHGNRLHGGRLALRFFPYPHLNLAVRLRCDMECLFMLFQNFASSTYSKRTSAISFWIRALFASDRSSKPCRNPY